MNKHINVKKTLNARGKLPATHKEVWTEVKNKYGLPDFKRSIISNK